MSAPKPPQTIVEQHFHKTCSHPTSAGLTFNDFLPVLSSAVIALVTIAAVHRLTRRRERDKAVFELHRILAEGANSLRSTVETGWTATTKAKRKAAVSDALWQLQRMGGMAEQCRRLSSQRRPLWRSKAVDLKIDMSKLRDTITLGDFDDETRSAMPEEVAATNSAITGFVEALDAALYRWMS